MADVKYFANTKMIKNLKNKFKNKWWFSTIRFFNWFSFRYWWFILLIFLGGIALFYFYCPLKKNNIMCDLIETNNKLNYLERSMEDCCDCFVRQLDTAFIDDASQDTIFLPDYDSIKRRMDCNAISKSGGDGITETIHNLGNKSGLVVINFNMKTEPDKLEVFYNGKLVNSTRMIKNNNNGFVGDKNSAGCCGTISFFYSAQGDDFCIVKVTGGGSNTQWEYTLGCPN